MQPVLLQWQQLHVDHVTEFALVLVITAQQHLSHHQQWQDRLPYLQSTPQQNHRVERLWPEINQHLALFRGHSS